METEKFDLIVLGGGSAARDGASKAARDYGAKVALVERTRWGGSCPNVACKPTKAYIVAADLLHDINELAGQIGLDVGRAEPDLARIRGRKEDLMKAQETWVADLEGQGLTTIEGEATFVGPRTLRVGDRELEAERILIATGSRTAVPEIEGIGDVPWVDHVSALELTELPASMLVLGGGPVGLEFGQIFARFGTRVTIVNGGPHMAARADREAAEEVQKALEDDGIELVHETRAAAVRKEGDEVVVTLDPGGRELRVEKLLLASGRAINVEELDLETAGVEHTPRGIVVDEYLRTSADGVWAAGDVTGLAQFTPIAQYQARIAVDDMFASARPASYDFLPTAIFTDPEIASVGLSEHEAQKRGLSYETVVNAVRNVTRSAFTNQIHVVTRGASDVVQGLALRLGATVDDLASAHHIYPSSAEGIKAAAEHAKTPV